MTYTIRHDSIGQIFLYIFFSIPAKKNLKTYFFVLTIKLYDIIYNKCDRETFNSNIIIKNFSYWALQNYRPKNCQPWNWFKKEAAFSKHNFGSEAKKKYFLKE